jgi:3-methylfumaryl-CoA hydratase
MVGNFSDWIGRTVTRSDIVTPRLVAEFQATLGSYLFAPRQADIAAPGFHWAIAPAIPTMTELGPDGAEAKGIFLPPIEQKRRMWAGGSIETFAPFRIGMAVSRASTISNVKVREAGAAPLWFVSVTHEFRSNEILLLRERQDLVFADGKPKLPQHGGDRPPIQPHIAWKIEASTTLLFRFSAVTFNGHRIHYDLPFAVEQEGYPGLLVHGPLQAMLLLNQSAMLLKKTPALFDYRCIAPLVAGHTFDVLSSRSSNGTSGLIVGHNGAVTIECSALAQGTSAT